MPSLQPRRQPALPALDWFEGEAGRVLLASEAPVLATATQERPGLPWVCISPLPRPRGPAAGDLGRVCWLRPVDTELLAGDLECATDAWPLAMESIGTVVLQHAGDCGLPWDWLLPEAERVLVPGGRLWLFGLNPLSPFRRHWWRQGMQESEPFSWRRRLRSHGLMPDPVAEGIGPAWALQPEFVLQTGAGGRAAYRLRAEKRSLPLTPARARLRVARPALGNA